MENVTTLSKMAALNTATPKGIFGTALMANLSNLSAGSFHRPARVNALRRSLHFSRPLQGIPRPMSVSDVSLTAHIWQIPVARNSRKSNGFSDAGGVWETLKAMLDQSESSDASREPPPGPDGTPSELPGGSTRRIVVLSASSAMAAAVGISALPPGSSAAPAVITPPPSDPPLTLEQVTPPIAPAGPLPSSEAATVALFERTTYSVVNIFDTALTSQVNTSGSVEVPEGNGSGIVWDEFGHIVTNFHVIGSSLARSPPLGSPVARVTLLGTDGLQKNFEAKLVGADRYKDLAVIQVQAPPSLLRALPIGSASNLRVGQKVFAIGNPFGFDHTLTVGVLSGVNRDILSQTGVVIGGGLQTDASINPGNSGGPLLDSMGRLIGINTAIYTRSGTSSGVGFAISADTVLRVVPQLIAFGKVVRPSLNVQLAADSVAKSLNVTSGVLVLSLNGSSAAGKAGLLPTRRGLGGNISLGDIITTLNGTKVGSSADLTRVLDGFQVGERVTLGVMRGGGEGGVVEVVVVLEEASGGKS